MAKAKQAEFTNSIQFGKVSKINYIADDGNVQAVYIKASGIDYGNSDQGKSQWFLTGEDEKKNPILIPIFRIMEEPNREN